MIRNFTKKTKKLSLLIAILVISLMFGSFLLVKITTQPLSLPKVQSKRVPIIEKKKQVEISYDGLSFNPQSVNINLGDSVTLKNQSNTLMEIAVGKHPSHQELKGFEEKVVKKGEDYTFTVKEKGQFEYHDHLKPKALGLITVN